MAKKLGNNRGAAVVEFALVALIFFIFVFGIIDFGWYFFCKHTIELATGEGARLGLVRSQDSVIKQGIRDRASIAVNLNDSDISISSVGGDPKTKQVTTDYTHYFFTPIIGAFFSDGHTTINAKVIYREEPEPYVPPS